MAKAFALLFGGTLFLLFGLTTAGLMYVVWATAWDPALPWSDTLSALVLAAITSMGTIAFYVDLVDTIKE